MENGLTQTQLYTNCTYVHGHGGYVDILWLSLEITEPTTKNHIRAFQLFILKYTYYYFYIQ
jgi:hypothetical protein